MIEVRYKCACMAEDATLEVRNRQTGEDVLDWMNATVLPVIGADHARRSPICTRRATEYAMIEYEEGSGGIGFKATRQ